MSSTEDLNPTDTNGADEHSGPEIVTINGRSFEVVEWDWRDVDDDIHTWTLYAREVS